MSMLFLIRDITVVCELHSGMTEQKNIFIYYTYYPLLWINANFNLNQQYRCFHIISNWVLPDSKERSNFTRLKRSKYDNSYNIAILYNTWKDMEIHLKTFCNILIWIQFKGYQNILFHHSVLSCVENKIFLDLL